MIVRTRAYDTKNRKDFGTELQGKNSNSRRLAVILRFECQSSFLDDVITDITYDLSLFPSSGKAFDRLKRKFLTRVKILRKSVHSSNKSRRQKTKLPAANLREREMKFHIFGQTQKVTFLASDRTKTAPSGQPARMTNTEDFRSTPSLTKRVRVDEKCLPRAT